MASPSSPAATADQVMCQPMITQHSTSTSSCGMVWYAATSIAATGKISRGIRIFWTRRLVLPDRPGAAVPGLAEVVDHHDAGEQVQREVGDVLVQLEDEPHHDVVDAEAHRRLDVGPRQAEQRRGVHLGELARDDQPQQVGLLDRLDDPAARCRGDQLGLDHPLLAGTGRLDDRHGVGLVLGHPAGTTGGVLAPTALVDGGLGLGLLVCGGHQRSSVEAAKVFSQRCGEVTSPSWSR